MRFSIGRREPWLGIAVVAVAACVVTGAFAVSGGGTITTIAGTGKPGFSGDGGPAIRARLNQPQSVAVDRQGNVYIVDIQNQRVRKVSRGGTISTFAGGGKGGLNAGDGGPATSAVLTLPDWVAVDQGGNVYISGESNLVRKVSRGGTITTFAGTDDCYSGACLEGEGVPATSAQLLSPLGMAADGKGNVYIVDGASQRVLKVSADGTITRVAGTYRKFGFSGDGGPATSALLNAPMGLALDRKGNLFIADWRNNRVRKVSSGGKITTYAGNGKYGYAGDGGRANKAQLEGPGAVAVDDAGNVYIAGGCCRVRKVSPGGVITTIAGTKTYGMSGDGGPASRAQLKGPRGVAVDGLGNVYIVDGGNHRVRKVRP